jgi:hypothetical protein
MAQHEGKTIVSRIAETLRPASTAQKIAATEQAIADLGREIETLQNTRAQQLLNDDLAVALATGDKIAAAERRLGAQGDRLAALQKQTKREAVDHRQREKVAALAVIEKRLADRTTAAARVDKAIAEFSASLQAYEAASRAPFASWSHSLFPSLQIFQGLSHSYAAARIAAALRMKSPGAAQALLKDVNIPRQSRGL